VDGIQNNTDTVANNTKVRANAKGKKCGEGKRELKR